MRITTFTVPSTLTATAAAAALVHAGAWFQVEPLPDDRFEFTVKPETLPLKKGPAMTFPADSLSATDCAPLLDILDDYIARLSDLRPGEASYAEVQHAIRLREKILSPPLDRGDTRCSQGSPEP
jgi:hypothetical protein